MSSVEVHSSPLDHVQLRLVETLDDALELKRWLGERRDVLGVDTESGGLNHHRDELRLVQVGDLNTGWALPWPLWGGFTQEILKSYEGPTVAHHRKFDVGFLSHRAEIDLPWANGHDTMIQAALVDPTRPKGLKPLSARLVDKRATAGETLLHDGMKQHGWTWGSVPYDFPPYWIYAALDPVLTCHLHAQLHPTVAARYQDVYQLELATARIAGRMSHVGLRVDRPYVEDAIVKLRDYSGRVRSWLDEHHSITSPLSSGQLAAAFERAGYPILDRTPTGKPKVNKDVLEGIAAASTMADVVTILGDDTPTPTAARLAKVIIDARHAEKVAGSYLEKFLELVDADDVVHCSINTLQARTGRMSITDPALQTLHRDDKVVRGSIIPRPGHALVTIDASQIEMRLAATLTEDTGLIAAFYEADNGGRDFYSGIAGELFGEVVDKKDPRRQAVKTMSYAKLYGASVGTMARSIGLPVAQVKPIHDAFNARFPGLDRFSKETISHAYAMKRAGERPATYTSLGRYLPCDPGVEFALVNYRFQGEAADILKRGMVDVDHAGFGELLRLPVHDELILEAPLEDAETVLHDVTQVLNDSTDYSVAIPWEGKVLTERWTKT